MHPDSVPLARAARHYLATLARQGYSPETGRLDRENLAQFAAYLGSEPTLVELTRESALRHPKHRQQRPQKATALRRSTGGLTPYTIHQHGRALRSFTIWLWRHGYLEDSRLADFHPGRLTSRGDAAGHATAAGRGAPVRGERWSGGRRHRPTWATGLG